MDIRMPEVNGIEATRQIKRELPSTVVLVLTALEDPTWLMEALKAGASGYLLKEANPQQITTAIGRVLQGESPLNQQMALHLIQRLIQEKQQREAQGGIASIEEASEGSRQKEGLLAQLTPREVEVLRLLAQGQTNRQIARTLHVGLSTVKTHVHHIIVKLGVSDRIQAAVVAIEHGLLALGVIEFVELFPTDLMV
jgi:DNA-binding NarL/FixJ family response regulator